MTESPSPGNCLVITLALLGGILIGIFAGAALLDWQRAIALLAKLSESAMAASLVGGLFGAVATGVATYIVTSYLQMRPSYDIIDYKIITIRDIFRAINNICEIVTSSNKLPLMDNIWIIQEIREIEATINSAPFNSENKRLPLPIYHNCALIEDEIRDFIRDLDISETGIYLRSDTKGNVYPTSGFEFKLQIRDSIQNGIAYTERMAREYKRRVFF